MRMRVLQVIAKHMEKHAPSQLLWAITLLPQPDPTLAPSWPPSFYSTSMKLTILDVTSKSDYAIFVFLCWTYLNLILQVH